MLSRAIRPFALLFLIATLAACGSAGLNLGRVGPAKTQTDPNVPVSSQRQLPPSVETGEGETSIWDAFRRKNTEAKIQVNRYLWKASLDVLSFMPVQSVDPFSGVIVFGYGNPPGGGRAYRATVLINDPALDARSLNVALATRGGPVSAGTQRAVEDAILNRARQMRIKDGKF